MLKLSNTSENFQYEFQPSQQEQLKDIIFMLEEQRLRIEQQHEDNSTAMNAMTNLAALTGLVAISSGLISKVKAPKLIDVIKWGL